MKIFISFSGDRSRNVAEALQVLFEDVILGVQVWFSPMNVYPGTRWFQELEGALSGSAFGVLCITQENTSALWIAFEAGALTKAFGEGKVCPYLIGLSSDELNEPYSLFQAAEASKEGTLKLVRAINYTCPEQDIDERLTRRFEKSWPSYEKILKKVLAQPAVEGPQSAPSAIEQMQRLLGQFREELQQQLQQDLLRKQKSLRQDALLPRSATTE